MLAGFPRVARRLDIKTYAARYRVTAVNYFSGSQLFNRALRYWCAVPPAHVAERAARFLRGGDRFKLSDRAFLVRAGQPHALAAELAQPMSGACAGAAGCFARLCLRQCQLLRANRGRSL